MLDINVQLPQVNEKNPNPKIFISDGKPCLHVEGKTFELPDHPFTRWMLRVTYPTMSADKKAAEWFLKHNPTKWLKPKGLRHEPKGLFQILGFHRMCLGSCGLWFDMGLGKTYLSIARSLNLAQTTEGQNNFYILCPTSLFSTWEEELRIHIDSSIDYDFILLHGSSAHKKITKLKTKKDNRISFIVSSYETNAILLDKLLPIHFKALYADEASKIKNLTIRRTAATNLRRHSTDFAYALSGTPSTKNFEGYWSLYEFIEKGSTGFKTLDDWNRVFINEIMLCRVRLPGGKVKVAKPENLEYLKTDSGIPYANLDYSFKFIKYMNKADKENNKIIPILNYFKKKQSNPLAADKLNEITKRWAFVVKKRSVIKDLPDVTFLTRTITMGADQKKAYKEFVENNRTLINNTPLSFNTNPNCPHTKLLQIANGYLNIEGEIHYFKKQLKIEEIKQIIAENQEEKIIIWSPFRPQLSLLEKTFKNNIVVLHGDVPIKKRGAIVEKFRDDKGPNLLGANPSVAGMGLNLQCSHLQIFMSNWYQADMRTQAISRQDRIGQTMPVTVIDLLTEGTNERRILSDLNRELDLESQILEVAEGVQNV